MPNTTIKGYRCNRCGHEWVPRGDTKPVVCPNKQCKSPYWDRSRQETKED